MLRCDTIAVAICGNCIPIPTGNFSCRLTKKCPTAKRNTSKFDLLSKKNKDCKITVDLDI